MKTIFRIVNLNSKDAFFQFTIHTAPYIYPSFFIYEHFSHLCIHKDKEEESRRKSKEFHVWFTDYDLKIS